MGWRTSEAQRGLEGSDVWPRTSFCQKGLRRSTLSGEGRVPLLHKQKTLFCEQDKDREELIYVGRKGAMAGGGRMRAAGTRETRAVFKEGMGRVPLFGEEG